jgi:hypothetical protein
MHGQFDPLSPAVVYSFFTANFGAVFIVRISSLVLFGMVDTTDNEDIFLILQVLVLLVSSRAVDFGLVSTTPIAKPSGSALLLTSCGTLPVWA